MKNNLFLAILSGCILIGFFPVFAASNLSSQLDQDFRSGQINRIQKMEYTLFSLYDKSLLPSKYAGFSPAFLGARGLTLFFMDLKKSRQFLSPAAGKILEGLAQLPTNAETCVSPEGHFRFYYYTSGENAVIGGDSVDSDGNSVPDYVDMMAAAFDSCWKKEVASLGFSPPAVLAHLGDSQHYKVNITKLPTGYYGFTNPLNNATFIEIRSEWNDFKILDWKNDSLNDYERDPRAAVRVTAAHEFFHSIQMTMVEDATQMASWTEGSAVWMEETVFPGVNDYFQYVQNFFDNTEKSFHNMPDPYATCVWPLYLSQRYGDAIIRSIWQNMQTLNGQVYRAMDQALMARQSSLAEAYGEMAIWCFFTGKRSDSSLYFAESPDYPPVKEFDTLRLQNLHEEASGTAAPIGFQYFRVLPGTASSRMVVFQGMIGTGTVPGGSWQAWAVGYDSSGQAPPSFHPLHPDAQGLGSVRIDDWNLYSEIGLLAVNTHLQNRQSFQFRVRPLETEQVTLSAGQYDTLSVAGGSVKFVFQATDTISSIFEFSQETHIPEIDSAGLTAVWPRYYQMQFTPPLENRAEHMMLLIRFHSVEMAQVESLDVRLEELACYVFDSAGGTWVFQSKALVSFTDSTIGFSVNRVGTYGLFRHELLPTAFYSYPSPADFRKYRQVYFYFPQGKTLEIYSGNGMLVRKLSSENTGEYEINRFVWNGANQNGVSIKPGLYYIVANHRSGAQKGKMIVLR